MSVHHPRRGSLGYYHRKRAARIYPRVLTRPDSKEAGIVEFAGYKVGMTHVIMVDDKKGSPTHNQEVFTPVTVLETPSLKVAAVRTYVEEPYGLKARDEAWAAKVDESLKRKVAMPKTRKAKADKIAADGVKSVRLLVYTAPKDTGVGKKTPELFEVEVGGPDAEAKLNFAKEKLGNEIKVSDFFKAGDRVDTIAVTKGFGVQGPVKRFGVKILAKKSEKVKRKAGNLGAWHPAKTQRTVPQVGQHGFHKRTEINKRILKISETPDEINVKGGFSGYGLVKGDFILIKGSVQGPRKRLVRFRQTMHTTKQTGGEPQLTYVSVESKQGL